MKQNYIDAYLETINTILPQKKINNISKQNLRRNLLIQSKRKQIKRRLIVEEKTTVECSVDVVVQYFEQINNGGIPDTKLWSTPDFIFDGRDNYEQRQISDDKQVTGQLQTQIKNIISSQGVIEELEKRNKEAKQGSKWCPIYFIEMGQIEDGQKGAPLFYLADRSSKPHIYQIIPKNQDYLEKAHSQLRMFQSKGGNFKVLTATASVGLTILQAGWALIRGLGGVFADIGKSIIHGTPLEKLFSSDNNEKPKEAQKKKKNYNEETKPIIAALIKYVKQKGQGYKGLSNQNKAKLNFITGITPDKPIQGLVNYKQMIDNNKDITREQYEALNSFRSELRDSLALDKCDKLQPSEIQQSFTKNPGTQKDLDSAMKIKGFKEKCRKLGFRDKKAATGFAAFFMNLLNKIMSLLGGNQQKKQASGDKIKEACPYIASQINKTIQPGKYPIYFGKDIHNVTDTEMKTKFETYCKK